MTRAIARFLIAFYQTGLRPLLPPACKYQPSCSDFAAQAITRHGARGFLMTLRRLARCHPFASGGFNPVPHG